MSIRVRTLPIDPGPAGWNRLLPSRAPQPALQGERSADWCVIGAGFTGLAAARRLLQIRPADRVAVLEAQEVAEGPAGRNSGFMIDLPHDLSSKSYAGALEADRAATQDNRRAITFALDMAQEFKLPPEAISRTGKINAAATAKGQRHNHEYARHLETMGEPFEMLDAGAMRRMTGLSYYRGGLKTPGTALIQPAAFVRGVVSGLMKAGVSVFENSAVTGLHHENGIWRVATAQGQVRARRVILAVNGHLQSFGFQPARLIHVHTYASMTRPLTADEDARLGGDPDWGVTPADPMGSTIRRVSGAGGSRIVVRNRFTFDPGMVPKAGWAKAIARDHRRAFLARFPQLADVGFEMIWGGRLCLSRNNVQVVDEVAPNLFAACCQNGLGTVRGTLAGLLAAELACGLQSPALARAQQEAPKRLPPAPVARLGATLHLKFAELWAGREL